MVNGRETWQRASTVDTRLHTCHDSHCLSTAFPNMSQRLLNKVKLVALEQAHSLTDRTLEHKGTFSSTDSIVDTVHKGIDKCPLLSLPDNSSFNRGISNLLHYSSCCHTVKSLRQLITSDLRAFLYKAIPSLLNSLSSFSHVSGSLCT